MHIVRFVFATFVYPNCTILQLIKQKGGPQVKLNQGNFVGRSLPLSPYLSPLVILNFKTYPFDQNFHCRKYFSTNKGLTTLRSRITGKEETRSIINISNLREGEKEP